MQAQFGGPSAASMRSVGSSFHGRLVRAFQKSRKVHASAAGDACISASSLRITAEQLEKAVEYERQLGLRNVQGREAPFNEFVAGRLRDLVHNDALGEGEKAVVVQLLDQAQRQYPGMTKADRGAFLEQLTHTMRQASRATVAGRPVAQHAQQAGQPAREHLPSMAALRYGKSRLLPLSRLTQQQEAFRQEQRAQQTQQEQQQRAGSPGVPSPKLPPPYPLSQQPHARSVSPLGQPPTQPPPYAGSPPPLPPAPAVPPPAPPPGWGQEGGSRAATTPASTSTRAASPPTPSPPQQSGSSLPPSPLQGKGAVPLDVQQEGAGRAGPAAEQRGGAGAGGGGGTGRRRSVGRAAVLEWPEGWPEPQEYTPPPPHALSRWVPVVFDVETTNRTRHGNQIVDLAAKCLLSGECFDQLARLEAHESVDRGAERTHGLSTAMLQDPQHPPRRDVLSAFCDWLEQRRSAVSPEATLLLIGHNIISFDCPILVHNLQQAGLPPPPPVRLLDTLLLARSLTALEEASRSLQDLAIRYRGTAVQQTHRALDDVLLLEEVLGHLRGELEKQEGLALGEGWEQALAHPELGRWFQNGKEGRRKLWLGEIDWRPSNGGGGSAGGGWAKPPKPSQQEVQVARLWEGFEMAKQPPSQPPPLPSQPPQPPAPEGGPGAGAGIGQMVGGDRGAAGEGDAALGLQWEAAGDDPLLSMEGSLTPQDAASGRQWWRALQAAGEGACRQSFLNSTLNRFTKGDLKFTPKPLRLLSVAGLTSLQDLVQYYPKEYRHMVPGRLPQQDGDAVCLPVQLVGDIKSSKAGTPWVKATLEVVPPPQLGLPHHPAAAAVSPDPPPSCKLQLVRYTSWQAADAVRMQLEQQLGGGAVVYGRVKRAWAKRGTVVWEFMTPEEVQWLPQPQAQTLFAGGREFIKPVFSACGELKGRDMAKHVGTALDILEAEQERWRDPLPPALLEQLGMGGYLEALKGMFYPESSQQLESSRRRLAFQELVALQMRLLLQRMVFRMATSSSQPPPQQPAGGEVVITDYSLVDRALGTLPFKLTGGQRHALDQLLGQMGRSPPMMALLQGDVGCGKTVVAFLSMLAAVGSGYQGAIMAPTEILAEQHYSNLLRLLGQLAAAGADGGAAPAAGPDSASPLPITAALLTGSVQGKERARVVAGLADGSIDIAVGTHALISKGVEFCRLGLAVVDEQHRFGVAQRTRLRDKCRPSPHVLYMTATPIPRTAALVKFGDTCQVTINEMPPGRKRVATSALVDSAHNRSRVYRHMHDEIAAGGQVYIICPLVDEIDKEGYEEVKAAKQEMERLVAQGIFREGQCGLLHGQMKAAEKDAALRAFAAGHTPVLISTTVVEVGVDVPAASLILVEHADRFGLAQLHQLRGRVGRGTRASHCYLMSDNPSSMERLKVMERHHSGFHVAEADLYIRGYGEVLGTSQSGKKENLTLCRLPADSDLVAPAREAAIGLLYGGGSLPDLTSWPPELLSLVFDAGKFQLDWGDGSQQGSSSEGE